MVTVLFSERSLRMLADSGSYERGRAYFDDERVQKLVVSGNTAKATVEGSELYRVLLTVDDVGLDGECECPYGAEGFFCKHCVAVALAWLKAKPALKDEPAKEPAPQRSLEDFLLSQKSSWLVAELLRAAAADPQLHARLEVAAGVRPYGDDLRLKLSDAIEILDFVDYKGARAYFRGVDDALEDLTEYARNGGVGARVLAEYALDLVEEAIQQVDDSDGGGLEALEQVESAHFEACMAVPPEDPLELADYLVDRALSSGYGVFRGAISNYAGVLGRAGTARYRERLEEAFRALPPRESGEHDGHRFNVTSLLEHVAQVQGGTDAAVEVLARDITDESDIVRIVQALRIKGRDEEALKWAERGLIDFPPTSGLRSLAAQCHLVAGRRKEAAKLLWDNFTAEPRTDAYRVLADAADELFPAWRKKAHAFLRKQPRRANRFSATPDYAPGHTTLVDALLSEGDIDAAWRAAKLGGCRDKTWLRLATLRAHTHPADAIPVFLEAADAEILWKKRDSYRAAAKLLLEAQKLYEHTDRLAEFKSYMAALRLEHKPKTALQDELTRARLP
jgi:hypothetical protein